MTTFEQILQAALGKETDSVSADTSVDVTSKGLDLEGPIEVRVASGIPEGEISDKAFEAASQRIDGIISNMLSQDVLSDKFYNKVKRAKVAGKVDIPTKVSGLQAANGKFISSLNLARILNATLFQHVKDNMGLPALVYRTGRFAHSAHVNGITGTSKSSNTKGSIFFSYMLMPYAVFAGHPTRDPAKLIRKSISDALRKALTPASFKRANFNIEERS